LAINVDGGRFGDVVFGEDHCAFFAACDPVVAAASFAAWGYAFEEAYLMSWFCLCCDVGGESYGEK
jgi:hypothetical protein